ncbi:leucine-rich repeat protein [Secundilactobacillus hailunensis]|uniref:Leucine-rich repeat protein n=1 Tax=Secundilactobacillus hailunensis TaxID=2559923 RepID=A0ABW1TCJ0_9LACO|nr:leucine-rich repeat protein [Secundilactobacillus hailunensis]
MMVITGFTLTATSASAQTETAVTPTNQPTDVSVAPASSGTPTSEQDTKTDSGQSQAGNSAVTSGDNPSKSIDTTSDSSSQPNDSGKPATDGSASQSDQKPADSTATPAVPAPTAAPVPETPATDYQYSQNGANYTISGYSGNQTNITLPSQYNGGSVTEIGAGVFNDKHISGTVTIPDSIITIGDNAFANNDFSAINLGKGVKTIGNDAFSRTANNSNSTNSISTVIIPDTVTSIGDRAFVNSKIKQLQFGDSASVSNSKVETIGADAFSGNQISGTVTIPGSVTSIGDRAFANNDITGVNLGKGVQTIGNDAFSRNISTDSHNNISTVIIPDSVTSIGTWAFANDNITQLQFGDPASDSNVKIETIGNGAFSGNNISGIVTIPKSVESIGQYGFDSKTTVVAKDAAGNYWIPSTDSNGKLTFTQLTDYNYDSNDNGTYTVTGYTGSLQQYLGTTSKDGSINGLTLPDTYNGKSVTAIGDAAFAGYVGNKISGAVTIPDTVIQIGKDAFTQNNISTVKLGSGVQVIGDDAFSINQINAVTIPNSVISIGTRAFAENQITGLKLGDSVQTIGDDAFARDKRQSDSNNQISGTVVIPDSVTSIGARSFANNDISGLTLGNQVQTISDDAFSGNQISGIVVIPDSVTSIGENAFANNRIETLVLGQNIRTIGLYAFDSNDISHITGAKSMVSDQYLRGQQGTVNVQINATDVSGNQIQHVKAAIEKALSVGGTTSFNLSDNLTFIDHDNKTWTYDAATDTLTGLNSQKSAVGILFTFSSDGLGSYGAQNLIFTIDQSENSSTPGQSGNNTGTVPPAAPNVPTQNNTGTVPPAAPNVPTQNNTGTVPLVTPNTPTQSGNDTDAVQPNDSGTPKQPAIPTIVSNMPTQYRHTTSIVPLSSSSDTTVLGHVSATKQSQTSTITTNQGDADAEQQGTIKNDHAASSQIGEQAGPVAQKETNNSATTAATPSHEVYQSTMTTKQSKQANQSATATLPQTNDDSSAKPTFIGALLLSILSWFGLARRKHEQD